MKRLIYFTGAVAMLLGACATPSKNIDVERSPVSYSLPHIKRPNLVVADIDRSLSLYRDVLGLTAGKPSISSSDSYSYPVFNIPTDASIRSVALSEPNEARTLALTEVKGVELPRPSAAPHMSAVVIGITGLKGKFERLKALGLEITEPKIADGAEFRFIEQAFTDYDGHLIVCYEILD